MRLYHTTTRKNAKSILARGFRNSSASYWNGMLYAGVWLADRALDIKEGAEGDTVLEIELRLTEADIAEFEWTEKGMPYREWLIDAALINTTASIKLGRCRPQPTQ